MRLTNSVSQCVGLAPKSLIISQGYFNGLYKSQSRAQALAVIHIYKTSMSYQVAEEIAPRGQSIPLGTPMQAGCPIHLQSKWTHSRPDLLCTNTPSWPCMQRYNAVLQCNLNTHHEISPHAIPLPQRNFSPASEPCNQLHQLGSNKPMHIQTRARCQEANLARFVGRYQMICEALITRA